MIEKDWAPTPSRSILPLKRRYFTPIWLITTACLAKVIFLSLFISTLVNCWNCLVSLKPQIFEQKANCSKLSCITKTSNLIFWTKTLWSKCLMIIFKLVVSDVVRIINAHLLDNSIQEWRTYLTKWAVGRCCSVIPHIINLSNYGDVCLSNIVTFDLWVQNYSL